MRHNVWIECGMEHANRIVAKTENGTTIYLRPKMEYKINPPPKSVVILVLWCGTVLMLAVFIMALIAYHHCDYSKAQVLLLVVIAQHLFGVDLENEYRKDFPKEDK